MLLEMVSLNVPVPGYVDQRTLEVIGAGLMFLLDKHKTLGTGLTDFQSMDHAKLTMGDHAAELCFGDADFDSIYTGACAGLQTALACNAPSIETFATQIDGISDIMVMEYPELVRIIVREKDINGNARNNNLYVLECNDPDCDIFGTDIV